MTTRQWKLLAVVALVTMLMVLMVVDPALAAGKTKTTADSGTTTHIGENLGREVQSWGSALLLGVATLVGLPALAKRDLGQSMVVAMIAVVLGGFVFAGDAVQTIIQSIWSTLER